MKKIFSIFFILLSIKGYAQNTNPQFLGGANSNLIVQGIMNLADSPRASLNWILADTNTTKSHFSSKLKGRWAREANGRLYYNPSGTRFVLADSITSSGGGGGAFYDSVLMATQYRLDTVKANLRSADAARVRYTDTATMLAPYVLGSRLADTAAAIRADIPNVSGKVNYSDTASMLANYLRKADTASLSNRINTKLNITDTANIRLRPIAGANMSITGTYPNLTFAAAGGGGSADSITFATNYRVDTAKANLRASIATKLNIADTATMLATYLRKVDTTAMLLPYLRKTDTASLSNRINLKANTASPTFTGTVTIPAGANITTPNILGLSSGTTNDSLVVADPTTGALKRISSSRISSGGGGGADTSAWHKGGDAVTVARKFGTTTNFDLPFIANNTEYGRLYKNGAWAFNESATATATGSLAIGFGAAASASYSTSIGIFSQTNALGAIALGNQARGNHSYSICVATKGSASTAYATNRDDQILFGALTGFDWQTTAGTNIMSLTPTAGLSINTFATLKSYTVATLPAGVAVGTVCYVTDATAPTFLGILVGGGAVGCLAVWDGTNWTAH